MTTTVQVSNATKQVLEALKQREKASSYDEVIRHLVETHTKIGKSMFGALRGLKWKKEDRLEFNER